MRGGVKFYRSSPGAARSYVEANRSRVDDYLAEGTGLATRYVASQATEGELAGGTLQVSVTAGGTLDGGSALASLRLRSRPTAYPAPAASH